MEKSTSKESTADIRRNIFEITAFRSENELAFDSKLLVDFDGLFAFGVNPIFYFIFLACAFYDGSDVGSFSL